MSNKMTRTANKRFLRRGFFLLNISGLLLILAYFIRSYEWMPEDRIIYPIIVLLIGLSGLGSFLFLVILGIMPHFFQAHDDPASSEGPKKDTGMVDFLTLKDD